MSVSLNNGDWTKLRQIIQSLRSSFNFFQPRRISSDSQPTSLKTGEIAIWHDSATAKVYWIYSDPTKGIVKVEMT